jgi:hypothetical protein
MKNVLLLLAFVAQFFVFYIVFFVGTMAGYMLDPFHPQWFVTHPTPGSTRYFTPDGLILTIVLYLVILAVEKGSKRTARSFVTSTAALVLALALGLLAKIGFSTPGL